MLRFQGRTFVKHNEQWFVWEPVWDSMRPIDGFCWNGTRYEIIDTSFTTDPFSELFGYGTREMKDVCEKLTDTLLDKIDTSPIVKHAIIGPPVWLRDRWVSIWDSSVSPNTWRAHAFATQTRTRTCRKQPRGKRWTKRVMPSDKICESISS